MYNYTCKETCNQEKPCGNKHCSAHPSHTPPPKKPRRKGSGGQ